MNNDLISRSALKEAIADATYNFEQIPIRVDEVQKIIDNAPTAKEAPRFIAYADGRIEQMKHFVHVTINDPKYGEVDGWLDKARQVLFTDAVTTEFAKKVYGWTWKEDR